MANWEPIEDEDDAAGADRWQIVPNPAFEGRTPKPLQPSCHDGTPSITLQCGCGEQMHMHESQIGGVPSGQGIASRCRGCGRLLTFEPEFFLKAFADLRAQGWLEPKSSSDEQRPVCPGCGRTAFLLCLGGCYQHHRHHAHCLMCNYRWRLRAEPHDMTCRECGAAGSETLDDSNPGLCPECHARHLKALAVKFGPMLEAHDPQIAAAWAREYLIEEAGMPPDWADMMSASMLSGRNYLEALHDLRR